MIASPLAYVALILFVPVAALLFVLLRPAVAVAAVLVSATLFLPEKTAFDAPLIPPMDKVTISSLCALIGVLCTRGMRVFRPWPERYVLAIAGLLLLGNVLTTLTNQDALVYGPTFIKGLTLHDAFSDTARITLSALIPFLLGYFLFRTRRDLVDLLRVLVAGALAYVPFILIELRMSPQFHRWLYGFHQHEFIQTLRDGGYRPMVFMEHGLALASFVFAGLVAATTLIKLRTTVLGLPAAAAALVLGVTLVLCKSMAALVYALVAVPMVLFWRARSKTRVAALLAMVVLAYPALRSTDTFPAHALVDLSARFDQERAQSLAHRFEHEQRLVQKAGQRPLFGWGGFGRNRIYNEEGVDLSVTDGAWIAVYGSGGVAGFSCIFGLLTIPIFRAGFTLRRMAEDNDRVLLATMALLLGFAGIDLLPNGLFSALPLFLAGALGGAARGRGVAVAAIKSGQAERPGSALDTSFGRRRRPLPRAARRLPSFPS